MKTYCTYLRVSTQRQGASGLGLESQRKICNDFIKQQNGRMLQEFMDVESGTHRDRKGLANALSFCKKNDCALVIAKLDRLCRDVEFCFKVINTGIEIHFCDMPSISTLLLGVFASVAQYERELTSDRTKKALAAKKARGAQLGGANSKFKETMKQKTKQQIEEIYAKKGTTTNRRRKESKEFIAMIKILRTVFPDATNGEPQTWKWNNITTRGDNKDKIYALMQDYRDIDESGSIFQKWNFNMDARKLQIKLGAFLQAIHKSIMYVN